MIFFPASVVCWLYLAEVLEHCSDITKKLMLFQRRASSIAGCRLECCWLDASKNTALFMCSMMCPGLFCACSAIISASLHYLIGIIYNKCAEKLCSALLWCLTWTVPIVQTGSLKAASPCVTAAICLRGYLLSSQPRCDESKHKCARRDTWQMTAHTWLRSRRHLRGRIMSKRNQFPVMNLGKKSARCL